MPSPFTQRSTPASTPVSSQGRGRRAEEAAKKKKAQEQRNAIINPVVDPERAKDPRNWEFHYKAPGNRMVGATKGMSAEERQVQAFQNARRSAESTAKTSGQDIYEIQQIQAETKKIEERTSRYKRASIQGKRQRSSRAAQGVAAQRQLANRRAGQSSGQATKLFDQPLKMGRLT